ncbi:hypothetical protein BD410DRAFT_895607 [Rickenella mellea]|uniref:Uncharacterized protein n=1 Tax=Rickenella mellea TaxID=50990 RepID=A0A4Y7QFK1_9AGAM|nr:hypothetical protein BD410DRAFT_895607 [Rickenella mellea]
MSSSMSRTTHLLSKYSLGLSADGDQRKSHNPISNVDWRHHTEPVLRLLLEISKTPSYELEAARLRIVWTKGNKISLNTDGKEDDGHSWENYICEDLDLLSFKKHINQLSSLQVPLKVVYRDNTVGFRYIQNIDHIQTSLPEYRRFQITFQRIEDVAQLIGCLSNFCPCKPNNAQGPSRGLRFNPSFYTPLHLDASKDLPPNFKTMANSQADFPLPLTTCTQNTQTFNTPAIPSLPSISYPSSDNNVTSTHTSNPLKSSATIFPPVTVSDSCPMDISSLEKLSLPSVDSTHSGLQRHKTVLPSTLQNHTPPPSDDNFSLNLAQDRAAQPTVASTDRDLHASSFVSNSKCSVVASLYESPEFNSLPQEELENLIAEIVREDGFIEMLEKVNRMWRVKGFVSS